MGFLPNSMNGVFEGELRVPMFSQSKYVPVDVHFLVIVVKIFFILYHQLRESRIEKNPLKGLRHLVVLANSVGDITLTKFDQQKRNHA
ncbi:hypothetical protein Y032_0208g2077 [Ancylostoma ceylanicum]|uniref:Uncharacterized protein n=1 Tax=Ancylostoma ceylanicum TaxID=53326 RepID=A0A016SLK4_9BILA|nr:hypothetical protein Y032_0208g2077 [Ancylostoma ceylanicum]